MYHNTNWDVTSKITLAANIDKMNWIALLPSEVILVEKETGKIPNCCC